MKKAKFWVDYCMEAGEESVCHRYGFGIDMSDKDYEELYQVWYNNNCELNSWNSDWQGHDKLFENLNVTAYNALNDMLKKSEPDFVNPVDAYWEISKETEEAF